MWGDKMVTFALSSMFLASICTSLIVIVIKLDKIIKILEVLP